MVLGTDHEDSGFRGKILELVTPKNEDPVIARCLISHAINRFRRKRVDVIDCWMFSHNHLFQEISTHGFSLRKKNYINLLFRIVSMGEVNTFGDIMGKKVNWYMSIGDSDFG